MKYDLMFTRHLNLVSVKSMPLNFSYMKIDDFSNAPYVI